MAMHNTNSILKYVIPVVIGMILVSVFYRAFHGSPASVTNKENTEYRIKGNATVDSAAESLNTLTAELAETKKQISEVTKTNNELKKQNSDLVSQVNTKHDDETSKLATDITQLKNQIQSMETKKTSDYRVNGGEGAQPISIVIDLTQSPDSKNHNTVNFMANDQTPVMIAGQQKHLEGQPKMIPYYTIPANGTSVKVRLMTALVGRIPVKGVVVDPYPFKVLLSDDNLAANGLRIPHLLQMVVSGYCEGDLVIQGVRGWITSLTFVFDDGTISSTTSNDNDIGNFTKANSLGYLSDKHGNPFIPGMKFITNAPMYLGGNISLGMATGAANAYAQAQTTNNSFLGNTTTAVTGSQSKFVIGQSAANGMSEAQQWWHDREQQSFDAVYVAPTDATGEYIEIAVNFAKEIHIDYNPKGRKLSYAHNNDAHVNARMD